MVDSVYKGRAALLEEEVKRDDQSHPKQWGNGEDYHFKLEHHCPCLQKGQFRTEITHLDNSEDDCLKGQIIDEERVGETEEQGEEWFLQGLKHQEVERHYLVLLSEVLDKFSIVELEPDESSHWEEEGDEEEVSHEDVS